MKIAQDYINLIAKAVGLAMGVAVITLLIMKTVTLYDAVLMTGVGITALGISHFTNTKQNKSQENK